MSIPINSIQQHSASSAENKQLNQVKRAAQQHQTYKTEKSAALFNNILQKYNKHSTSNINTLVDTNTSADTNSDKNITNLSSQFVQNIVCSLLSDIIPQNENSSFGEQVFSKEVNNMLVRKVSEKIGRSIVEPVIKEVEAKTIKHNKLLEVNSK